MIELPTDVQLLILDHIRLPSHLKALCLTNKSLRRLATPLLYRTITIDLGEAFKFEKCMKAGGALHLQATRSLTFLGDRLPTEAHSALPGPWNFDQNFVPPSFGCGPGDYTLMCDILRFLPKDTLHTFRYLTCMPLDGGMVELLRRTQSGSLRNLHVSLGDDGDWCPVDNPRTLDLFITEFAKPDDFRHGSGESFLGPKLERLSLVSNSDALFDLICVKPLLAPPNQPPSVLEALTVLTLSSCRLRGLGRALANALLVHRLTSLTVWKCEESEEFLNALVQAAEGKQLSLNHFALCLDDRAPMSINESVSFVLSSCTRLESLCLEWNGRRGFSPIALFEYARKLGRTLRILSLHDARPHSTGDRPEDALSNEEFELLCTHCPRLEQLGYRIWEDNVFELSMLRTFLFTLAQLRHLKILYLHQTFLEPGVYPPQRDERTFGLQKMANHIFDYLSRQSLNHSLEALVIGQETYPFHRYEDDEGVAYTPRHCFVKGEQRDILGRKIIVGVPVPSYYLRYEKDYAGIMDWCSAWESELEALWMPRIPGRFHGD